VRGPVTTLRAALLLGLIACAAPAWADEAPDADVQAAEARPETEVRLAEAIEAASVWRAENRLLLAEEGLWKAYEIAPSPELRVELAEVAVGQRRPHAARALVAEVPEGTRGLADLVGGLPPAPNAKGIDAAVRLRAAGKLDEAEYALRGLDGIQRAQVERGYIAAAQKRSDRARSWFDKASKGSDDSLAVLAHRELWVLPKTMASGVFAEAQELRTNGEVARANRLLRALLPFQDRQRVALELGWTAMAGDDLPGARHWLAVAAAGRDDGLAETAIAQLEMLGESEALTSSAESTPAPPAEPGPEPLVAPTPAQSLQATFEAARELRAEGQYNRAAEQFEAARALGAADQVIDMELGYTWLDAGRPEAAREVLERAAGGPDADMASRADDLLATLQARRGARFIEQARAYRVEENWEMATMSLETATKEGADACAVALERGYLEGAQNHGVKARQAFREAAQCDEKAIRKAARAELRAKYRLFWGDFYGELFGWHRFLPQESRNTNLVPTARVRGYIHPVPHLDIDPYVFFQISRDAASRAQGPNGFPLILADNTAMFGVGVLMRAWYRRIGLYAQIGPAINLLNDGRPRWFLDARVAGFFAVSAPTCNPSPQLGAPGARLEFSPCAEVYAEAVWVSRFDNNIFTMGRGRVGFTALVTGPVAWQPIAEGRVLKDILNDYWNNLADAGLGIRWRLLTPIGLDVMLGVHGGSYFGLYNVDLPPDPLGYAELRLQAATYIAW